MAPERRSTSRAPRRPRRDLRRGNERAAARAVLEQACPRRPRAAPAVAWPRRAEELAALGVRPPGRPRPEPRAHPGRAAVAELAAAGLMNREIAQRLFVTERPSRRTSARRYRKLGLRTRRELGGALAG
jgi:DNA-binding NarL/FixJ family response regulator